MLHIAVCDDEVSIINELDIVLEEIGKKHGIKLVIEEFFDGATLLDHIKKNDVRYDMIFLDIEMNVLNGIDTAKEIRKLDEFVYLIYITNYKSYALKAYEAYPYQFVLKPILPSIIETHFLKICKRISSDDFFYEYKYKKSYYKILVKEIIYFESNLRMVNIYLADGKVLKYYDKLNEVEEKLKNGKAIFWRVQQSILVNSRYVRRKSYDQIELINGEIFFISADRRKGISTQYLQMVEDE